MYTSLEFQPVLIVSVGGREPSGDSGHTFLSSDGMWVEYIHWALPVRRVHSLEPYPQECKIASRMQPLYITVLFKLWVIIHVVNRMITFLTDRTFCPESPDGSLPPTLTMRTGWNSRLGDFFYKSLEVGGLCRRAVFTNCSLVWTWVLGLYISVGVS